MTDRLVYYLDNRGPTIIRRLSTQTDAFDIEPGLTFRLRVRNRWGSATIIDALMEPDVDSDTLTYEPQDGDFSAEGSYRAWITTDFGSNVTQDTDEFVIDVLAHAPGETARVGYVWRAARAKIPTAWDALRSYIDYGDPELQRVIELAKLRVLRTAVPPDNEASLDPRVVDYIAKKVLVDDVLEAAIDYYRNKVVSRTAQGNSSEVETYPDRIAALERQLGRFQADLEAQAGELDEILGTGSGTKLLAPALSGVGPLVTPGLESFPRPYRQMYPWEDGGRW